VYRRLRVAVFLWLDRQGEQKQWEGQDLVGRRQRLHRRLQGQLQDPEGSKYELQPDGTHTLFSVKCDVGSKEVKKEVSKGHHI
jgi:hypothetical protein